MVFTIYACADVDGDKANFEIGFNGMPTLQDLHVRVVEVFTLARREAGSHGAFQVAAIVFHNRSTDAWEDLVSERQLQPSTQLYVFQPDHRDDMSRPLPQPMLPPAALAPSRVETLARSSRSTYSVLRSPSTGDSRVHRTETSFGTFSDPTPIAASRRIQLNDSLEAPQQSMRSMQPAANEDQGREDAVAAFRMLDQDRDGVITLRALHDTMVRLNVDASPAAVGDTFAFGDRTVTAAEFRNFGAAYPAATSELRRGLQRAGPEVVASPPPVTRPPPNPDGPVAPGPRHPSPVRRRAPASGKRPVSPAVSHREQPPQLDSRAPHPAPASGADPSGGKPRCLLHTSKPLTAMDAAELDALELQLLRLLEEARRKRGAFEQEL
jgi:hypothetical protein